MYIHVGVLHNNAMNSSVLQSSIHAYYVFVCVYCMYDVHIIYSIFTKYAYPDCVCPCV